MFRDIAVAIFFTSFVCVRSQNLFTSFDKLKPLITTEEKLLEHVSEYIENEEDKIETMKHLLSEIKKERGMKTDLGNPVQSYMLIRRLRKQWIKMDELIGSNKNAEDHRVNIAMLKSSDDKSYPTEKDYKGAIDALLRLQETYNLRVSDIADGHIGRNKTSAPLTATDCFDIGVKAWQVSTSENVCDWMTEAENRLTKDTNYLLPDIFTQRIECSVKEEMKEEKEVRVLLSKIMNLDPDNVYANQKESHLRKKFETDMTVKNYKALCRGEDIGVQRATNMICRYNHYNKPRLFIRPAKEEMLSNEPHVVLFHDILTDTEIDLLIAQARPKLFRALIKDNHTQVESNIRISSIAWLSNLGDTMGLRSVLPRVQDYTGLSTDPQHTHPFQVANYGLGGFYRYHVDDAAVSR
ncbi:prolyl 4-hydroxylase subunit alpha-1-like [Amphiura filiformis]|uniref:prolyl 4-hydroxylase subunit alpha-1-like n=1 Tax=Amphiura filiformis TaxID=82378 RepID=UPI003B21BABF